MLLTTIILPSISAIPVWKTCCLGAVALFAMCAVTVSVCE